MAPYGASVAALARIRAEPDFFASVARESAPWLGRIPEVRAAVLANATDAKRADQYDWMRRYADMLDVRLFPEEDQ